MTPNRPASSLAALTLGAIGVVYGDIGTSPLYALKEVFAERPCAAHAGSNIYGVLSLVFWTLTVVVSVKYVVLILRADNNGEGGLIAMLALASQAVRDRPQLRRRLLFVGIFGTAIFFGDGVITPAISVLSAVEGLEVAAPGLHTYIVPVTLVVLTCLFMVQRHGTARVGKLFGPVMAVWFVVLAVLGIWPHRRQPGDPGGAVARTTRSSSCSAHPGVAFIALGSVVLCVTGAEALYADMGHFGKRPIRVAWFGLAMPALVLNYFGQGAMLLVDPEKVEQPVLRDGADLGALSADRPGDLRHGDRLAGADHRGLLGHQAGDPARLPAAPAHRCTPRSTRPARSTCRSSTGACTPASCIAVVLFGSSSKLAAAYGITVTIDMLITTTMTFFVIRYGWKYPWSLAIARDRLLLHRRLRLLRRQHRQGARRRLVPAADRRR